jgi:hypothetical protein
MEPRVAAAVLTLIMLASLCSARAGDTPASARKAIQAGYDRMAAAAGRRDVDGWLALKTPDFVSVSLDGTENGLEGRRTMMRLVFATVERVKARTVIVGFKLLSPSRARAVVHDHTEMTFARPDKKVSTMIIDTDAESTWIKTPAGWRESRSRSLEERGTLDGRPMPRS